MSWSEETDNPEGREPRSELTEDLEVLRRLPIFKDIPLEIIKLYAYTAKRRRFRTGDFIFRRGEPSQQAHVVLSGEVRLFVEKDGQEVELQVLKPIGFFGYMSLLARFDWPINSQAISETELLILERESFRKILTRFPEKCLLIVERLVQMRIKRMENHMRVLTGMLNQDDQVAALLRMEG
jgi:CRP/FNR family transcriptional regulator, cyclic AMP receptor protein